MRLHALARGLIVLAVVLTLPADAMALTAPSWERVPRSMADRPPAYRYLAGRAGNPRGGTP